MIRALYREMPSEADRAGPLPLGRRPHQPGGRRGHHLPLHPRRRRRPRGHRRRAGRAQGAHARARTRLAAPRRPGHPAGRDRVRDQDEIAEEARTVLLDGVRRIGGEVRNSLDFHHAQEGMSLRVQRAVLTGAAATVPGFDDAPGRRARPAGRLRRRSTARPTAWIPTCSRSRPAWPSRRPRTHEGCQPHPSRPAARRRWRRRASSGGGAYILLGRARASWCSPPPTTLTGKSVDDKKAELADITQQADGRRGEGRLADRYTKFARSAPSASRPSRQLADSRFDWATPARGRAGPARERLADLADGDDAPTASTSAAAPAPPALRALDPSRRSRCRLHHQPGRVARLIARLRLVDGVQRVSARDSTKGQEAGGTASGGGGGGGDCRSGHATSPIQRRRLLRRAGAAARRPPARPRRPATGARAAPRLRPPRLDHHRPSVTGVPQVTARDRTVLIVVGLVALLGGFWFLAIAPSARRRPTSRPRSPSRRRASTPRRPAPPAPRPRASSTTTRLRDRRPPRQGRAGRRRHAVARLPARAHRAGQPRRLPLDQADQHAVRRRRAAGASGRRRGRRPRPTATRRPPRRDPRRDQSRRRFRPARPSAPRLPDDAVLLQLHRLVLRHAALPEGDRPASPR